MRGRTTAVAAVLMLLSACSVGPVRRPPPTPPPAAPTATIPRYEVRQAPVPVPPSFHLQQVEFVDADHAYALFVRCGASGAAPAPGESCTAALARTDDGGRSWRRLDHPHPDAAGHQLYADRERLVLYVERDGYHVSRDRGGTYTREGGPESPPPAYFAILGRYQTCCDADPRQSVVEWTGETSRRLLHQPPVGDVVAVGALGHRLLAVGLDAHGRPLAAVADGGGPWHRIPVAGGSPKLVTARILVDHGGTYAWLIGQQDLISWPAVWFFDDRGWRPVGTAGHPERFVSAVALEDAGLAVTTPDGSGLLAGGAFQRHQPWPIGDCHLRLLPDGTLVCGSGPVSWLGAGRGAARTWIRVVVGQE